jgi:hypothetical protein
LYFLLEEEYDQSDTDPSVKGEAMQGFQDVFISYGRKDSLTFADQLNRRLVALDLVVWFDFDDIPVGVDYQKQIDDGIERSDNFVFVISPHAINSPYCLKEIELALKRNKRIIPVMHVERVSRETWQIHNPDGTEAQWQDYQARGLHDHFQNMHPEVRKINWIYMRGAGVGTAAAAIAVPLSRRRAIAGRSLVKDPVPGLAAAVLAYGSAL